MPNDNTVSEHYLHGNLLKEIETAVSKLNKTANTLTIRDLASVDEFHIGGRFTTKQFLDQLNFSQQDHILDVGCGLGGAARFVASTYNAQVTGIDITQEFVETGKILNSWVKLDKQITLRHGSAVAMPFQNGTFDGGYMMHVGMNIGDKNQLFSEIHRVLRPGASFGIYDVMRNKADMLTYPVPWAAENSSCQIATLETYKQALRQAGFALIKETDQHEFALNALKRLRAAEADREQRPLGLHIIMGQETAVKIQNLNDNIASGLITPVELIVKKR